MMTDQEVDQMLEAMFGTIVQAMVNVGVTKEMASAIFSEYSRLIEGELFRRVVEGSFGETLP